MNELIDYYKRKEISNSDLTSFDAGARRFKYHKDHPDEDKFDTKSLKKGRAFHTKLLEPEVFKKDYIPMDVNTPSSSQQRQFCIDFLSLKKQYNTDDQSLAQAVLNNYKIKDGNPNLALVKGIVLHEELKDYLHYLNIEDSESIILTHAEYDEIIGSTNALHEDPITAYYINQTISGGEIYNEQEIYWNVDWAPYVKLKSRLDRIIVFPDESKAIYVDPKTTKNANPKYFPYSIFKYGYHKQMDFYSTALQGWLFNKYGTVFDIDVYLIAVELLPPYERGVYKMSKEILDEGKKIWEDQLTRLNWHMENNVWIDKEYHEHGYVTIKPKENDKEAQ